VTAPAATEPKSLEEILREGTPEPTDVRPVRLISDRMRSRLACVGVLTAVALAARLIATNLSYDVFIDEVSYTNVSKNVASGHGLTLYGQAFNIHPPLGFLVYGAAILLFGIRGSTVHILFELRTVAEVFGSLTPGVLFLMLDRFRSRVVAVFAAMVVALDPFVLLFDTRVMLEPIAGLAIAGTFACIGGAAVAQPGSSKQRWWLVGTGALAAATITTKETFGGVLLVALLVMLLTGWVLRRRQVLAVVAVMLTGAGIGALGSGIANGFTSWFTTKVNDFNRLVGASQETGFNAPGMHVTFLQRALADLHEFWPSYILLTGGTVAAVLIVVTLRPWSAGRKGRPPLTGEQRAKLALAVWTLCSSAYLAYAMPFGSLEEQMYYIVIVPAAAALVVWSSMVGETSRLFRKYAAVVILAWTDRRGEPYSAYASVKRLTAAVLMLVVLCGDFAVWADVHTRPDDEYRTLLAWVPQHIPNGSVISVTEDIAQFLVQDAVLGDWETVPQLKQHHVDYLLLSTALVQQEYVNGTPQFYEYVTAHGRLVFQDDGPSDGALQLWDVRPITGAALPGEHRQATVAVEHHQTRRHQATAGAAVERTRERTSAHES
jgi:hypothetical protein